MNAAVATGTADKREIVRRFLELIGHTSEPECRQVAARFRAALAKANPDLSNEEMSIYDQAFASELPRLAQATLQAQIDTLVEALPVDHLRIWSNVLDDPDAPALFASLRLLLSAVNVSNQQVFSTLGVAAHTRSTHQLFARLGVAAGESSGA